MTDKKVESSRSSNRELPLVEELRQILAAEAKVPVPTSKTDSHFVSFEVAIELSRQIGVDSAWLSDDPEHTFENGASAQLAGAAWVEAVLPKLSSTPIEQQNGLFDYLSDEDVFDKADIAVVFGGKSLFRPAKAAELYHAGKVSKIMPTGGRPVYAGADYVPDAETYAEELRKLEVPEEAIIVEDKSITVPDNAYRAIAAISELDLDRPRVVLVNSPYALRRGYGHFMKHCPENWQVFRVASEVKPEYQRDVWYQSPDVARVILNEYVKMRTSVVLDTA